MFNLITAPCGSGKTTAAINVIIKLASSPRTALFLIDTKNGNRRLAQEDALTMPYAFYEECHKHTRFPSAEFDPDKIVVTTYAQFGVWEKHNPGFHSFFDVIICDEAHNIITFPNYSPQPNYASIARDAICDAVYNCDTLVIGMTATPEKLQKLNCRINRMPIDVSKLRQYETRECCAYASLPQLFVKLPKDKKGAIYTAHIETMKKCEELAIAAGLKPICVWSTSSEKPMSEEQHAALTYILKNEQIPPQYDLFIFNDSCATSINLYGKLHYFVAHTTNADSITQARGRYRGDLETLYCYDRNNIELDVPKEFLEIRLYQEDKKRLREQLAIKLESGDPMPYKQMFLHIEDSGYSVEYGRKNNRRYFIIKEL